MDVDDATSSRKKAGLTTGLLTATLLAGGLAALTLPAANAAPSAGTTAETPQRTGETALTGDVAAKVEAAALAAVPGAAVDRVETNDGGESAYEVHLIKADGTRVTVLVAADLSVVSVQEGRTGDATAPRASRAPAARQVRAAQAGAVPAAVAPVTRAAGRQPAPRRRARRPAPPRRTPPRSERPPDPGRARALHPSGAGLSSRVAQL
jgi:hypothetical protein